MRPAPPKVAFLHYSAPPVIGGVENVMLAHARFLIKAGHPCVFLAGRGAQEALPAGAEWFPIAELDSQHPKILELSKLLEQGQLPAGFEDMVNRLTNLLAPLVRSIDVLIVHNVFTKHFNLPLTAALFRLLDDGVLRRCVAWCHDITWTSPSSRAKVHPGYPWDLLRTYRSDLTYVTISAERQEELANLLQSPRTQVQIIPNGVDPQEVLALSDAGSALIDRLHLWESDLNLLLPVRITQAKNLELAVRVIAVLKQKGVDSRLVVTGPPDPHSPANMQYFQGLRDLRAQHGVVEEVLFVYESGPEPDQPLIVGMEVVADLLRLSDALFMPSHREGFGMPILEAGLAGIPVFCSTAIPAANEIGGGDVIQFSPDAHPQEVARLLLEWMEESPVYRLARRVRQQFTWQSIMRRQILPLIQGVDP